MDFSISSNAKHPCNQTLLDSITIEATLVIAITGSMHRGIYWLRRSHHCCGSPRHRKSKPSLLH